MEVPELDEGGGFVLHEVFGERKVRIHHDLLLHCRDLFEFEGDEGEFLEPDLGGLGLGVLVFALEGLEKFEKTGVLEGNLGG